LSFSTRTDDDKDKDGKKRKKKSLTNKHYRYTIQPPQIPVQAGKIKIKSQIKNFRRQKAFPSHPQNCGFFLFLKENLWHFCLAFLLWLF
jgi:hypothetical protein